MNIDEAEKMGTPGPWHQGEVRSTILYGPPDPERFCPIVATVQPRLNSNWKANAALICHYRKTHKAMRDALFALLDARYDALPQAEVTLKAAQEVEGL